MSQKSYGSVCSGIEAASVAWHSLGWRAAWLAEIEPFPAAVLRHHYPDVPNYGDMTALAARVRELEIEAPDVLVGGTPCQAFSVAGLRQSLDDDRGQLTIKFLELADAIDTVRRTRKEPECIIVWENVPGVLNTKDNAFGCFLAGLAGESEPLLPAGGRWTDAGCVYGPTRTVAWRVLDAQHFGLAQRRRRVFVVASARNDFDPAAVLFEFDGVRRDTAPSREAREGVAGTLEASLGRSRGAGTPPGALWGADVAPTLAGCANGGGANGPGRDVDSVESLQVITMAHGQGGGVEATAFVQNSRDEVRLMGGDGGIVGALAAEAGMKQQCYVTYPIETHATLDANNGSRRHNGVTSMAHGQGGAEIGFDRGPKLTCNHEAPIVAHTLNTQCGSATEDGTGRGAPLVPVAFHPTQDPISSDDGITHALGCWSSGGCASVAVAYPIDMRNAMRDPDKHDEQNRQGCGLGDNQPAVRIDMQVRRLTPVECERLQGFPDNYTAIPWRKKPASECPDGPRYKALGNSMAVPVMRWIGERIDNFHRALQTDKDEE